MLIYSGEINDEFLQKLYCDEGSKLILCSPGGFLNVMNAAIDRIRACGTAILATGHIASAAVPILAAGGARQCTPRTRFMVHPAFMTLDDGNAKEFAIEAEEMKRATTQYWQDLADFTRKKTASWWEKQCEVSPFYFGPVEAVKLGLVDALLTS